MKKVIIIILLLVVAAAGYALWSLSGRSGSGADPALYLDDISSYGSDSDNGNIVGVQAYMEPADYVSAEAFQAKVNSYLAEADAQGWLQPDTIVVFPEWMGTWLVLADEKEEIYQAESLEAAMQLMVMSNIPSFANAYTKATGADKIQDSLFRMKAENTAEIYSVTFSNLAQEYGITIVAGSLDLPDPTAENDRLVVGSGAIQNVSPVFRPDGSLYPKCPRSCGQLLAAGQLDSIIMLIYTHSKQNLK